MKNKLKIIMTSMFTKNYVAAMFSMFLCGESISLCPKKIYVVEKISMCPKKNYVTPMFPNMPMW